MRRTRRSCKVGRGGPGARAPPRAPVELRTAWRNDTIETNLSTKGGTLYGAGETDRHIFRPVNLTHLWSGSWHHWDIPSQYGRDGLWGEGTYALTHYVEGELGAKSGTWSQYGFVSLQDGTNLGFRGQGTWEEISSGKWRYRGTGQLSDGSTYATEFEGDWATRTWAGKAFEWS